MQTCEIDLVCASRKMDDYESTTALNEEGVKVFNGEEDLNITYLKLMLANKNRRPRMRQSTKMRGSHMGDALKAKLNIDTMAVNKETKRGLLRFPSAEKSSTKLIPEGDTEPESKLEGLAPVKLPQEDPYPVKSGHHFLIETSFEAKNSEDTDEEELIGYQIPKDTIEGKMHYAAKSLRKFNWDEMRSFKIKPNEVEDQFVNETREKSKAKNIWRYKSLSMQEFKKRRKSMLKSTLSKVKMINFMGALLGKDINKQPEKKPKRRSVDMTHINKLHLSKSAREFQKRGISDKNFIGMVKECKFSKI